MQQNEPGKERAVEKIERSLCYAEIYACRGLPRPLLSGRSETGRRPAHRGPRFGRFAERGAVGFIPSRSTMTRPFRGQSPTVPDSAFIDPTAVVIGKVTLGEHVGVWPNTTIRGDVADITIGDESNIQDNCCLHVDRGEPLVVGRRCVVGHSATLHACEPRFRRAAWSPAFPEKCAAKRPTRSSSAFAAAPTATWNSPANTERTCNG